MQNFLLSKAKQTYGVIGSSFSLTLYFLINVWKEYYYFC